MPKVKIADLTPEQAQLFSDACARIQPVHTINYAGNEEMLKALDMIEELNRGRFIKRDIEQYNRLWNEYYQFLSKNARMTYHAFYVDYCNEVYKMLEPKTDALCDALRKYFSNGKTATVDHTLLARLVTARMMFVTASHLYLQVIDFYKARHADFSAYFGYASMASVAQQTDNIIRRLFPRYVTTSLSDKHIENAFDEVLDIVESRGIFDEAQLNAIEKSTVLTRKDIHDNNATQTT